MKYHYSIYTDTKLLATSESVDGFEGYDTEAEARQAAQIRTKNATSSYLSIDYIIKIKSVGKAEDFFATLFLIAVIIFVGFVLYQFWGTVTQFILFILVVAGVFRLVLR